MIDYNLLNGASIKSLCNPLNLLLLSFSYDTEIFKFSLKKIFCETILFILKFFIIDFYVLVVAVAVNANTFFGESLFFIKSAIFKYVVLKLCDHSDTQ